MNSWELSKRIADLLLVSDGDVEWTKAPRVRQGWHFLILLTVATFVGKYILQQIEPPPTLIISGYLAVIMILSLSALAYLMYQYYFCLLLPGKDLRLKGIVFFMVTAAILFSILYRELFFLNGNLFSYPAPILTSRAHMNGLAGWLSLHLTLLDFLIYSACTMLFLSYPRIASNSMLVSALNVIQVLFTVVMLSLLVATFVNKTSASKENRRG
jgi:hypothetical protein